MVNWKGQETIGEALTLAAKHLKGKIMTGDELVKVDAAFARFNRKRPSDDAAECAAELLKIMRM